MRVQFYALAAVAVLAMDPAAAINKCTGADSRDISGRSVCRSQIRDFERQAGLGDSPRRFCQSERAFVSGPQQTEAARLEGIVSASQRSRRSLDLKERLLPDAERDLREHRVRCEEKQKKLASQQDIYRQNLYGKTHAAQIASEIAAASAAVCDTKDRELKESMRLRRSAPL